MVFGIPLHTFILALLGTTAVLGTVVGVAYYYTKTEPWEPPLGEEEEHEEEMIPEEEEEGVEEELPGEEEEVIPPPPPPPPEEEEEEVPPHEEEETLPEEQEEEEEVTPPPEEEEEVVPPPPPEEEEAEEEEILPPPPPPPEEEEEEETGPVTPPSGYFDAPKHLYVWGATQAKRIDNVPAWRVFLREGAKVGGAGEYLRDFCLLHGFSEVYLFGGSIEWEGDEFASGVLPEQVGLRAMVTLLGQAGIKSSLLVYINDDPNNLVGWERTAEVVTAVRQFNSGQPPEGRLRAIHFDQEPSNSAQYSSLMNGFRAAMAASGNGEVEIESSLKPKWLTETWMDTSTGAIGYFAAHVLQVLHGASVMAYSNSIPKVKEYANSFGSIVRTVQQSSGGGARHAGVAVETGQAGAAESETLATYVSTGDEWFETAGELFVNILTQQSGLVDHIVVHDYSQYHMGLYGIEAWGAPKETLNKLHAH